MNMIARFDKNKDGRLSKAEVPQPMAGLFDRMDQNKDGFVDQNEMRSMGGKGRPQGGGGGSPQLDPTTGLPVGGGKGRPQPRTKQ
jgi:Ca2+-binding EF-hand superfamily protein